MVTTIDAGRSETVETRRNLVPNAAFAVNSSGWDTTTGGGGVVAVTTTGGAPDPAGWVRYARVTVTTAGTWFRLRSGALPVVAGKAYTLSGWVRGAPAVVNELRLIISWYRGDGSWISDDVTGSGLVSSSFTRSSFTVISPDGAASARVLFGRNSGAVGDFIDIAGVLFEQSDSMGVWFYGATPNAAPYSYAFVGPANASASIQQLTRQVRVVPRLVDGFEASREVRNVLHPLLNRASPDVSFREPGLRSGEFRCLFETQADALYAFSVLSVPQVFTITDPDAPAVDMLFVLPPGELRIELDDETRRVWWVVVPFQEVES